MYYVCLFSYSVQRNSVLGKKSYVKTLSNVERFSANDVIGMLFDGNNNPVMTPHASSLPTDTCDTVALASSNNMCPPSYLLHDIFSSFCEFCKKDVCLCTTNSNLSKKQTFFSSKNTIHQMSEKDCNKSMLLTPKKRQIHNKSLSSSKKTRKKGTFFKNRERVKRNMSLTPELDITNNTKNVLINNESMLACEKINDNRKSSEWKIITNQKNNAIDAESTLRVSICRYLPSESGLPCQPFCNFPTTRMSSGRLSMKPCSFPNKTMYDFDCLHVLCLFLHILKW